MIDVEILADEFGEFDIAPSGDDLKHEDSLQTSIIISLFSNARVNGEEGFWGSSIDGEEWGSKLWTLRREKLSEETRKRYEEYSAEALKWLKDENIAKDVKVSSEIVKPDRIYTSIQVIKPNGEVINYKFNQVWSSNGMV